MEIFTMDREEELSVEKLQEFLDGHAKRQPRYKRMKDMYENDHEILHQEDKEMGKPDNRLVVNFAKYIVDTLNGYFIGIPVKTVHDNKDIADKLKTIAKRNSQNDNNAELSKLCSIYGHAYEFLYQDEEARTRVTYIKPQEAFLIYDDTIAQEPLYGVRVIKDKEGRSKGSIYSKEDERHFYTGEDGLIIEQESIDHFFQDVPLIEYVENEERQSAFESVESLINANDKGLSEKANDVDYFADAYLAVLGAELDEDTLKEIKDSRVINLKGGDTDKIILEFLDKPNADETQENLLNRVERLIFQISMVANISDEKFGTSTGIALKFKLQPMENISLMKERKFNKGMNRRFKMMFSIPTNFGVDPEEYLNIDYIFKRNIPNNVLEEAEASSKLSGIASKRTQLGMLSVVDNVQDELDQIEKEKDEKGINSFNRDMNTSLIQQQKQQEVIEDGQE
ncbi:phage portal protein [Oceanobacillus neutriphilus]|uniref:Phage portal protein n=1 Tax=Oceanobacillus neutriphilus TaxID=531815 RepID=A0ABQ2NMQ8_9BACI|nr:phage portal protein [Oceanobacillus neutriphilus]GGP07299.1 hypothetical protein GCM10011346_02730 [Oceanobacillus neutriphilus]